MAEPDNTGDFSLTTPTEMEPGRCAFDLPDEILSICFAHLPVLDLPLVRMVCKRWLRLARAAALGHLRRALKLTQPCTFHLENEYLSGSYRALRGRAFDPQSLRTHPIATLEGPQRLQFGALGVDGRVYVLGGRSPLLCQTRKAWMVYSRVDAYEPLSNSWQQIQPMRRARFGFAAGAFVDPLRRTSKLIVAGGLGWDGEALALAEVFDFYEGLWMPIPSMGHLAGPCRGEVFQGKFYVQQANSGSDSALEVFDPSEGRWTFGLPALLEFAFKDEEYYKCGISITMDV